MLGVLSVFGGERLIYFYGVGFRIDYFSLIYYE